ncbi:hypothetical protein L0664_13175 [Octadecabacter sp. G9-8]|uniref:Response regulatory domain-containing protein n=1 Tax=Octadecabacter dasysiphoniae TaxID=2909341 RepID=A0ABS9CYP9_9RHOB|nr:hypothetical protein [Octadecabacter dasysiphoniae]MCF2872021.1 hypothetical protein [Octadecabacter dasysiphoniae]
MHNRETLPAGLRMITGLFIALVVAMATVIIFVLTVLNRLDLPILWAFFWTLVVYATSGSLSLVITMVLFSKRDERLRNGLTARGGRSVRGTENRIRFNERRIGAQTTRLCRAWDKELTSRHGLNVIPIKQVMMGRVLNQVNGHPQDADLVDDLTANVVRLGANSKPQIGTESALAYFGEAHSRNFDAIADWAGQDIGLVLAVRSEEASWKEVQSIIDRADVYFVDADFMGDLEDTVDYCLRLRNHAPNIPLILISSEVRGHDLTAERSAICDVTLKPPLTKAIIQNGLSTAYQNQRRG